jgi:hypothetical protein
LKPYETDAIIEQLNAPYLESAKLKEWLEVFRSATVRKAFSTFNVPETLKDLLPSSADSFSIKVDFDEFLTKSDLRANFLIELVHAKVKFFGRKENHNDSEKEDKLLRPIAILFTFSTALNPDPKVNKVFKIYLIYNGPVHSNTELIFVKNYESYHKQTIVHDCLEFVADTRNFLKGNTSNSSFLDTAKLPKVSNVFDINKAINEYLSTLTFKKHTLSKSLDVYFGIIVISEFVKHMQFRGGVGDQYYHFLKATYMLDLEHPIEFYKDYDGNINRTILGLFPNRAIDLAEKRSTLL